MEKSPKSYSNGKEIILQWETSGQTVKSWCRENEIPTTTFYGWKSRLKKQSNIQSTKFEPLSSKNAFIELKNIKPTKSGIILECEGVKIHLEADFDPVILKKSIVCLREIKC